MLLQAKSITEFYENAQNVEKKTITSVLGVEEKFFHSFYRLRDDDDFDSTDFKFVYSKNMIIKLGAITTFCYSTFDNKIVCAASTTCERDVTGQFMRAKIQLIDHVWQKIIWSRNTTVYSDWAPVDECVTAEFSHTPFESLSSFTCCGCQPKTNGNSVTCL